MQSTPYQLVDTPTAWRACLEQIRGHHRVALDLEANSLYVYREQICLIQLSLPGADFILDPLAGFPLAGLDEVLADPAVEKVFHASEYDLILLKREYGWPVVNLFDTMWAARILGYTNMGLAWFLAEFYSVTLSKKYQKTDWSRRPLSSEQLEYAYKDTHVLLDLRHNLVGKLEEAGLMQEAREIFANESNVRVPQRLFNPEGFWSLRGIRELPVGARPIVAELFLYREAEAQRRNLPPFKVFTNEVILALARSAPRNHAEMNALRGVPGAVRRQYGDILLELIEKGRGAPVPKPPQRSQATEVGILERFERLQHWRKEMAQQRGVESDGIITRETMWAIAHLNPLSLDELAQVTTLGPHRLALYGPQILHQLSTA